MLRTDKDKAICAKFSARKDGKVQCGKCPLVRGDRICKANADYNPKTREWETNYWGIDWVTLYVETCGGNYEEEAE